MSRQEYLEMFSRMSKNKRCEIAIQDLWVGKQRWGPVTWNVIYMEVWHKTKISRQILKTL